ncbi:MAG: LytTR family DNA-binding domain-containing protein [Cryomorphaceae bacterium]
MINIAIIDDEPAALSILTRTCNESNLPLNVVGTASSIQSAVDLIRTEKPQLVLLDIEFPEGTGFEVLEGCEGLSFEVIFITAHENYAIKAIKHHALDYILKPINGDEVTKAIVGAIGHIEANEASRWTELLKFLKGKKKEKFPLPIKDGYRYIELDDLVYLKADGSYAHLHFTDGSNTLVSKKLAWFEERLGDQGFKRVHRSFLVNEDHIVELHRNDGGYVVVSTGDRVSVSKNYGV